MHGVADDDVDLLQERAGIPAGACRRCEWAVGRRRCHHDDDLGLTGRVGPLNHFGYGVLVVGDPAKSPKHLRNGGGRDGDGQLNLETLGHQRLAVTLETVDTDDSLANFWRRSASSPDIPAGHQDSVSDDDTREAALYTVEQLRRQERFMLEVTR